MIKYRIKKKGGWYISCPFCSERVYFTRLVAWNNYTPFFYSTKSNDVLMRKSDAEIIEKLFRSKNSPGEWAKPCDKELESAYLNLLKNAPTPPGGGVFDLWANVKCPSCRNELPYNGGVRDLSVRLHDPYIILIDKAVVVTDLEKDSWMVSVEYSGE